MDDQVRLAEHLRATMPRPERIARQSARHAAGGGGGKRFDPRGTVHRDRHRRRPGEGACGCCAPPGPVSRNRWT